MENKLTLKQADKALLAMDWFVLNICHSYNIFYGYISYAGDIAVRDVSEKGS